VARPAKHAPLLRGYLSHLSDERRLSAHTARNYMRDVETLIELA
jgi:site-specific recombinase XerC